MEDLRQGEGIIDLVNAYVEVGLFYGLIGLLLFAGFISQALIKAYRFARRMVRPDPDLALLGWSLAACIFGTMVMMATCSLIYGYQKMFYVLGGLAVAYAPPAPLPGACVDTRRYYAAAQRRRLQAHQTISGAALSADRPPR